MGGGVWALVDSASHDFGHTMLWAVLATALLIGAHLGATVISGRPAESRPRSSLFPRLTFAAAMLGVLTLGGTALFALLVHGRLAGWALLAHTLAGGVALPALAFLALVWGAASRPGRSAAQDRRFSATARAVFWLVLVAAVVAGGSILIVALPWLGTITIERALVLHRFAGLTLLCTTMVHGYLVLLGRRGRRGSTPSRP